MKPNIALIMADQFVWHGIGEIGGWIDTPNLDRMVREGVCFENCWTGSPLCLPARASFLTGKYPGELKLEDNASPGLNKNSKTWVQSLRKGGYETGLFGKLHAYKWPEDLRTKEDLVRELGFDHICEIPGPRTYGIKKSMYYDYLQEKGLLESYNRDLEERYKRSVYDTKPTPLPVEDYADVFVMDQALEWINIHGSKREWFLQISFGGPHEPWDTPQEYVDIYKDRTMPLPLKKPVNRSEKRATGVYDELLNGQYDPLLNESINDISTEDIKRIRKSYAGHITLIDEQIGRLMECLDKNGELNHTIFVFTSDHGEQNGDYGLLFKQTFLNSSAKIPLVIWKPDQSLPCKRVKSDVELMDLGATILQFAGCSGDEGSHARSLFPYFTGDSSEEPDCKREFIISQLYGETMVMNWNYKAVFNRFGEIYMLFDRMMDPDEGCNLAGTKVEEGLRGWKRFIPS